MNLVNTTFNSTEDMINNLQQLKSKTKLKFYKNISNYYNEKKNKSFQIQQDIFAKNAQGISKNYHGVLLLMKYLQTKPQVKNMNNKYYDLYYTVIKVRGENEDIDNRYEDDNVDYINFFAFKTPNPYIGIKNDNEIIKWRKMRSQMNHFKLFILFK